MILDVDQLALEELPVGQRSGNLLAITGIFWTNRGLRKMATDVFARPPLGSAFQTPERWPALSPNASHRQIYRLSQLLPPWPARPNACGLYSLGGPRNCGSMSRRSARRA